jgi:hypothetical protein
MRHSAQLRRMAILPHFDANLADYKPHGYKPWRLKTEASWSPKTDRQSRRRTTIKGNAVT